MKAIVTGATGCVGRNLVDELLKDGWEVTVFHRKSSHIERLKGLNINLAEVDLHDLNSVINAVPENFDVIFHAAGNVSHWPLEADIQYKDNVIATRNLIKASEIKKIKKFIFTSTGATYIHSHKTPEETKSIKCDYIRTKLQSEFEVRLGISRGLDAVIIRPCIIMGRYDFSNYSQIFQRLFFGKFLVVLPGSIWFNHAKDVARAHIKAFEKGKTGAAYFLGGNKTNWFDVYCRAAKIMQVKPPLFKTPLWLLNIIAFFMLAFSYVTRIKPPLTPQLIDLLLPVVKVSEDEFQKTRNDLDFKPATLEEALSACIHWMQEEGMIRDKNRTSSIIIPGSNLKKLSLPWR